MKEATKTVSYSLELGVEEIEAIRKVLGVPPEACYVKIQSTEYGTFIRNISLDLPIKTKPSYVLDYYIKG